MKIFTSKNQKIGLLGEKYAEMFLVKHGFSIIDRNFSTRFGEIDIVAVKDNSYHFIEVKTITVSHETNLNSDKDTGVIITTKNDNMKSCETVFSGGKTVRKTVSRETFILEYRKTKNPFQNVSFRKIKRLAKTVELFLIKNNINNTTRWQIDAVGVFLDLKDKKATFHYIENISIQ
jgi:Holliday junction resolvase-like predicted endonuclease